ncbi:oligosaccharide flippase family protein [Vibrio alginolyticus]|uniref:oligosaccharide flippase family protein n=1 Tax=Vibrio alginolyticus TaxID=663 RepID=UPI000802DC1E|nr:oligosaccharide flippase family protein [Vibrio alginolyticus]ANP63456.1 hypothetical protein BAU10_00035 [Vibrio alginolyticus]
MIKILNNKFLRNVGIVATGTAGAQIINVLASPIITRIYGPEAYGMLGLFNSILYVLLPASALAYPHAIVISSSRIKELALTYISLVVSTLLSTTLIFCLYFFYDFFNSTVVKDILIYLYLLPIAIIFYNLYQAIDNIYIKHGHFRSKAKASLNHAFLTNAIRIIGGWFHGTPSVLIFTTALNSFLHLLCLARCNFSFLVSYKKEVKKIKCFHLINTARRFIDFPKYRALQAFLNPLSQSLPLLLMASYFGVAVVGYYTLSRSLLVLPVSVIGNSVGNVFYSKANNMYKKKEKILPLLTNITFALVLVCAPPFLIIFFYGIEIFSFIFGEDWAVAGEFAKWIAIWQFFALINRPCSMIFNTFRMLKFTFYIEVIGVILRVVVLYVTYQLSQDSLITIINFCMVGVFINLYSIIVCFLKTINYDNLLTLDKSIL